MAVQGPCLNAIKHHVRGVIITFDILEPNLSAARQLLDPQVRHRQVVDPPQAEALHDAYGSGLTSTPKSGVML